MLETGQKAPDFALKDQNDTLVRLSDYLGKKVVLYFYSRDNTPGCTRQACAFAASYDRFRQRNRKQHLWCHPELWQHRGLVPEQ